MKTMRRYFAMLLTLIMSFSLVTSAAAAETKTVVVGDVSIDFGVEETTVMPRGVWAFWDECNGKNNYNNSPCQLYYEININNHSISLQYI